ncbi:MFS transporter [Protaetiibacter intestinalis]|uniref:MFS transporter n=1 Tax=Protaetiibacter intestinalis TaxID=2419774 RepID=A0A387B5D3_9MICO|nr:MFS transporter [Protaetiibacter intestinalis]AYF97613.1 MFS transporter [Protaetiibacter intestinalis]
MTSAPATSAPTTRERPGARLWWTVVLVGLVGQLAWTVENMYLNVFVYETITPDPTVTATLVASSAVAATLATIVVGAWSDRTGRRRPFIAVGYLAWGASTAAFGLLAPAEGVVAAPYVLAAVVGIIALDCVMSIFGSGANDAAFNAWVTDATTPRTRGRVDGVVAVMPLLAMLLVFGALDGLTRAGEWRLFFAIVGGAVVVTGVVSWFLVRDVPQAARPASEPSMLARLVQGFRPSAIRANPALYLSLLTWLVVGTASQVFLPYVIIYLQYGLQIESYALVLGVSLLTASVISVLGGRLMDRIGKRRMLLPATALFALGLVLLFFARDMVSVIVAASLALGGMMTAIASLSATVRDETPEGRAGMVQGLRMVTVIMVPMVVGPFIGAAVITGAGRSYIDLGVERPVPGAEIFLAAAVVLVLVPAVAVLRARAEKRAR